RCDQGATGQAGDTATDRRVARGDVRDRPRLDCLGGAGDHRLTESLRRRERRANCGRVDLAAGPGSAYREVIGYVRVRRTRRGGGDHANRASARETRTWRRPTGVVAHVAGTSDSAWGPHRAVRR